VRLMIDRQIDKLSVDELRSLETASIVGIEFSTTVVAVAGEGDSVQIDEWCDSLVRRRQFLQPSPPVMRPDGTLETCYRFLHALYRAAVYDHVPRARRALLHRRIGEHLEQRYGNQSREIAAELAVHFEEGQDWARALKWLQQAAANATNRSASREAVSVA